MKRIWSIVLLVFLFAGSVQFVQAENKTEFFVDVKAAQGGDGSINSPFNSIEEAQSAIRTLKKNNYPQGGITVNLREGEYRRLSSIELTKEDSGLDGAPVIYRAYANEKVEIVGGTHIPFNQFHAAENNVIDDSLKGKIYSCNLKENGIEGYDRLYISGSGAYDEVLFNFIDKSENDNRADTPEVFLDGEAYSLARYPNDGYMTIDTVIEAGDSTGGWIEPEASPLYVPPEARHMPPRPIKFTATDERISKWVNAKDAWVFGYWFYDWSDLTLKVAEIDEKTKSIKTKYPSTFSARPGQRFYIFNLLEELDVPGEWFYDRESGVLYIYPKNSNPDSDVLLSFLKYPLLSMKDVKNVEFRNINFMGTRGDGVTLNDCENVSVNYCGVSKLSGTGIRITGGLKVRINGCIISDTGSRGIHLEGGDLQTLTPSGHIVENCWIYNFGRLKKTYEGALTLIGVGHTVRNNLMHDGPHMAIGIAGNDHLIENNEIFNVLKETADAGVIYAGRNMAGRGTILRGNIIHDCYTSSTSNTGIFGIYLDDQQCGYTAEDNIIYNMGTRAAVFISGGRNNTITNNIFANITGSSVWLRATGRGGNFKDGSIFNPGYYQLVKQPYQSWAYSKYPNLKDIAEDNPMDPKYNVIKNNVSYNTGKEIDISLLTEEGSTLTLEQLNKISAIEEGVVTKSDLGFQSVKDNLFSLKTDSAVFKDLPEFKNIDISRTGLITSRLRNLLSNDAIVLVIGNPQAYVNWNRKFIDERNPDITPLIQDELTYVPLRFIAEALGAEVRYENDKLLIEYNGTNVSLAADSNIAALNGEETELDSDVKIINDRAFVPVSSFSKLFGKEIFWDNKGIVIISGNSLKDKLSDSMINDLIDRLR